LKNKTSTLILRIQRIIIIITNGKEASLFCLSTKGKERKIYFNTYLNLLVVLFNYERRSLNSSLNNEKEKGVIMSLLFFF